MLIEQVTKLQKLGKREDADKVQKILHEHLMHKAQLMHPVTMMQPAWGGGGAGGGVSGIYAPPPFPAPERPYTFEEQLAMRMRWGRIEESKWAPGFEHVAVHAPAGGTMVHIWVVTKDAQSTVLEDEVSLFPSDALVTKLNMLKG
jgi:hypothetical protein